MELFKFWGLSDISQKCYVKVRLGEDDEEQEQDKQKSNGDQEQTQDAQDELVHLLHFTQGRIPRRSLRARFDIRTKVTRLPVHGCPGLGLLLLLDAAGCSVDVARGGQLHGVFSHWGGHDAVGGAVGLVGEDRHSVAGVCGLAPGAWHERVAVGH